jgi:PadR family transcriptional regulator
MVISPQTFRGRRPLNRPRRVSTELELLQGTLDLLVLKTLTWGPMHGYAVARWIRETTKEELQVEEGALYTALHRMEKRGWVAADWGLSENNRRARYYRLTPVGRRQLSRETLAFERYAEAVFRILRTA